MHRILLQSNGGYYNGHLRSDFGEEFSFHFVIFQTQSEGIGQYF